MEDDEADELAAAFEARDGEERVRLRSMVFFPASGADAGTRRGIVR